MDYFSSYGFAGAYFIVFGTWEILLACRRYHTCRRKGLKFKSNTSYNCDCMCGTLRDHPVESYVKIVVLLCGMSLEIILGTKDGWSTPGLHHAKFASIYFFLAVSSLTDLFTHYLTFSPFNIEYTCLLFSYFVEWILVRFPEQRDLPPLEKLLYKLFEYVIFITMVTVAMEMLYRCHTVPIFLRSYFMLLQGSWLWQVAFILWKPSFGLPWKHDNEGDLTLACLFFAWHCGGDLVWVALISSFVTFRHRGKDLAKYRKKDEMQMKSLIKPKKNGQTIISLGSYDEEDDDDDSDMEFQRRHK